MTYRKTSRRMFYKAFIRTTPRVVYGQWLKLSKGDQLKDADELVRVLIRRTVDLLETQGLRPIRGTTQIGFYPGKWMGYRFEATHD